MVAISSSFRFFRIGKLVWLYYKNSRITSLTSLSKLKFLWNMKKFLIRNCRVTTVQNLKLMLHKKSIKTTLHSTNAPVQAYQSNSVYLENLSFFTIILYLFFCYTDLILNFREFQFFSLFFLLTRQSLINYSRLRFSK